MFKHDEFLEKYPHMVNKDKCDFKAYSTAGDAGFVILQYTNKVTLYEYDNGPYNFLGTYETFEDAAEASLNFC